MGSDLDHPTMIEHDDLVCVANGRESVGNGERRPALGEALERVLDGPLGLCVERRGRLVEDEDGRLRRIVRAMARRCFSPPEKR